MKVSDIDFSAYNYKRIHIEGKTLLYFPENTEETIKREYGDCVVIGEPEEQKSSCLVIKVEK